MESRWASSGHSDPLLAPSRYHSPSFRLRLQKHASPHSFLLIPSRLISLLLSFQTYSLLNQHTMDSFTQSAQRKPRIFLVLAVGALVFLLYYASQESNSIIIRRLPGGGVALRNEDLAIRLHMAEENFQRSLKKRKDLIKQFGPTADKIVS